MDFKINYWHYEYLVMFFCLTNTPFALIDFINRILNKFRVLFERGEKHLKDTFELC